MFRIILIFTAVAAVIAIIGYARCIAKKKSTDKKWLTDLDAYTEMYAGSQDNEEQKNKRINTNMFVIAPSGSCGHRYVINSDNIDNALE